MVDCITTEIVKRQGNYFIQNILLLAFYLQTLTFKKVNYHFHFRRIKTPLNNILNKENGPEEG